MKIDREFMKWGREYLKPNVEIRKQNDSGIVLGTCIALGILLLVMISTCNPAHAETIAGYDIEKWADAIHKAEGNDNYGILSIKCETKQECRRICKNTVRNNYKRWKRSQQDISYLHFLARRYAPSQASNDPNNLNQYWPKNVKYFLEREA